CMQGLESPYSF
nr:immunoglobulin light chain junction region [Macaca mulatta]MOX54764.1 immunoglobulin light chain junction region [Macaca mulatta]